MPASGLSLPDFIHPDDDGPRRLDPRQDEGLDWWLRWWSWPRTTGDTATDGSRPCFVGKGGK